MGRVRARALTLPARSGRCGCGGKLRVGECIWRSSAGDEFALVRGVMELGVVYIEDCGS